MARNHLAAVAGTVAALALLAWLLSAGGGAKVKGQLRLAAGAGDDAPVTVGRPVRHGTIPDKWVPHVPRNAHMGRHRIYRHPPCSRPVLSAPAQRDYDWLYSPPSEGDL